MTWFTRLLTASKRMVLQRVFWRPGAFEYTFLRQWDRAVSDFDGALELQPNYGVALTGLAQALSHQENFSRAEAVAKRGLELYIDPARQAPFWAALAENYSAQETGRLRCMPGNRH